MVAPNLRNSFVPRPIAECRAGGRRPRFPRRGRHRARRGSDEPPQFPRRRHRRGRRARRRRRPRLRQRRRAGLPDPPGDRHRPRRQRRPGHVLHRPRGIPGQPPLGSARHRQCPPTRSTARSNRRPSVFRIFEYRWIDGKLTLIREVTLGTPGVLGITWSAHLANKKASFHKYLRNGRGEGSARPAAECVGRGSALARDRFRPALNQRRLRGSGQVQGGDERRTPARRHAPSTPTATPSSSTSASSAPTPRGGSS